MRQGHMALMLAFSDISSMQIFCTTKLEISIESEKVPLLPL
jgi:hypothetical protein